MATLKSITSSPAKYAREERVSAAILLFVGLVAIAFLRRQRLPDEKGLVAMFGAAIALILVANFAPDLVFYVLLAAMIVSILQNKDTIQNVFSMGVARVQAAVA